MAIIGNLVCMFMVGHMLFP